MTHHTDIALSPIYQIDILTTLLTLNNTPKALLRPTEGNIDQTKNQPYFRNPSIQLTSQPIPNQTTNQHQ